MLPKWHILSGAIFSLFLYFFFNLNIFCSAIVFFSSFLFDVDHYFFYVIRNKDLSLKRAYKWNVALTKRHKPIMHIFHSLEFMTLMVLLSFFHKVFLFAFVGLLFHSILDILDLIINNKPNAREFSLIRYFVFKKSDKYF